MTRSIVLSAIITLGVIACDFGRLRLPENPSLGTLTAIMNGKKWHETYKNAYQRVELYYELLIISRPCHTDRNNLLSELYSSKGYLRQRLFLLNLPKLSGRYPIAPVSDECDIVRDRVYCELYTLEQDGDVLADIYNATDDAGNFLQLDYYNKKTGEIKGSFQVTLVMRRNGGAPALPDTLRFTDGKFHSKFIN